MIVSPKTNEPFDWLSKCQTTLCRYREKFQKFQRAQWNTESFNLIMMNRLQWMGTFLKQCEVRPLKTIVSGWAPGIVISAKCPYCYRVILVFDYQIMLLRCHWWNGRILGEYFCFIIHSILNVTIFYGRPSHLIFIWYGCQICSYFFAITRDHCGVLRSMLTAVYDE